jgi:uncharacterized protein (TIGR00369 family)
MDLTQEILDRLNNNSLYHTIGIRIEKARSGQAISKLNPTTEVCWPSPGQPHGGILFTLLDTTMAWAVLSALEPGYSCTTVDLNIQYTQPARGDSFSCIASLVHKTGRTAFVRGEIRDLTGQVTALAQGSFRIIKGDLVQEPS